MFDVPCHHIKHIALGLSEPWCDSAFGKMNALVAYNFLYEFFEGPEKIECFLCPYLSWT